MVKCRAFINNAHPGNTTFHTPQAPLSYTLVYIYEALDGTAEIMRIQDIVFDAFPAENG